VETLAATPDTLSVTAAAAFLFCLAKAQSDQRWWLMAGLAGGLGLLAKYSGFFVGAGGLFWLLAAPRARAALRTVWPWAGGVLAVLVFLPNLWWQSHHHWMTFAFQFGRVSGGHLTLRYLVEFFGAQLGLATPLVFALMILGGWRAANRYDPRFLLLSLAAPALVYFLIHATHDRVQGNWPCFLYPMLSIMAADAFGRGPWPLVSRLAMPVAALFLFAAYLQAATGIVPLKADPLARLLGDGMTDVAERAGALEKQTGAHLLLASDYEMTSWFRFYGSGLSVVAVDQPERYLDARTQRVEGPALYVADRAPDLGLLQGFASVTRLPDLQRSWRGRTVARYSTWLLATPKRNIQGKSP
jgi:Dolichyl-phosphate-mannose-protein mannosyltransferase